MKTKEEITDRAKRAREKRAALGEDVDIGQFETRTEEHETLGALSELGEEYTQDLLRAGIEPSEKDRSGSFLQRDRSVVFSKVHYPGLEIMSTTDALATYEWLTEYLWQLIPVDADKYTAEVELAASHGYFIRAKPGAKVTLPVQSCLFITADKVRQNVHNVVIAEENSELHIITGCSVSHSVTTALHLGVSEFYVKPGAKITFTMVHNWSSGMEVRPRSAVRVEDNGVFISNYILMTPVKSLQMFPTTYCVGRNARTTTQSIIYATQHANIDMGARGASGRGEQGGTHLSRDREG